VERKERKSVECTYSDGGSLSEEANEVETQLATRCESDTERDHADYDGQLAIWFLDAEGPGDKEDGNGRKRLDNDSTSRDEKEVAKLMKKKNRGTP
jgi:hypothetical protein